MDQQFSLGIYTVTVMSVPMGSIEMVFRERADVFAFAIYKDFFRIYATIKDSDRWHFTETAILRWEVLSVRNDGKTLMWKL